MSLRKPNIFWLLGCAAVLLGAAIALSSGLWQRGHQDANRALRVVLIPADGSTADGTLADYKPVFAELAKATGLTFSLTASQSYSAAVQALCSGAADVAFLGPAAFLAARERGCVQLLAVGVRRGQPLYYSTIIVRQDDPARSLADLRGKRLALGDVHSTSSFQIPLIMLLEAGLDPACDLRAIRVTGSHPESLSALLHGHVDAAALSLDSYERALRSGVPGVANLRVLSRSEPLPYPPFAMSTRLSPDIRNRLVRGFGALSAQKSGGAVSLVGYAGGKLDGYLAGVSDEPYDRLAARLSRLSPQMRAQVLARAGEREQVAGHAR